jgi:predicted amidohydrolase YtcJ
MSPRVTTATIFLGGPILTMTSDPSHETKAVLVAGKRIQAVGSIEDVREFARHNYGSVEEHDLAGRTLLPGFVDAHAHPLMFGQMNAWIDIGPNVAPSIPALIAVMQGENRSRPGLEPLRAFGYEHRNLKEGRHPSRWDLDQVSTTREVYVMNASGHGGVVNSYALESCGIDHKTPDPDGGVFERDENGTPTGVLWDAACDQLTGQDGVKIGNHGPNFHMPDSQANLTDQLRQAEGVFLANGVTTIGDAQASRREIETYIDGFRRGLLRSRYSIYVISSLIPQLCDLGLASGFGSEFLSIAGVKLYADGTLGGWTAYFPEGYADDPCRHGQLYHSPEEYLQLFSKVTHQGFQVATHAQSPTAIQMVIDAARANAIASESGSPFGIIPPRIEHCGLPNTKQINEISELGIIPVSQPMHHYNWGDGVISAVGYEVGSRFNPLGEFAKAGIEFALSSDAPVAKPEPFAAIMAAAKRRTIYGTRLGDDSLAISVEDALFAHTMGGAKALNRNHEIGSIEAGKLADFVVVNADPRTLPLDDLLGLHIEETWIGGEQVFG